MFERFTERARQVVVNAQHEARNLGHGYIGTEHILLGLVRIEGSVASRILLDFDADAEKIRSEVLRMLSSPGRREHAGTPRPIPAVAPPRWEYKLEGAGGLSEERLNGLGADGWELVSLVPPDRLVFKRRRLGG